MVGTNHTENNADGIDLETWLSAVGVDDDARYILGCRDCKNAWPYQRDSKTVKGARNGDIECPDCGETVEMVKDAKGDN